MSVRQPGQRSFCKHDYSHCLQTRVRLGLHFHLLVTREVGEEERSPIALFTDRHPATNLTFLQLPCVHCSLFGRFTLSE